MAIVVGGAAELSDAIFELETSPSLCIAPFNDANANILVSCGWRCNVSNQKVAASDDHGTRKVIDLVRRQFDEQATI